MKRKVVAAFVTPLLRRAPTLLSACFEFFLRGGAALFGFVGLEGSSKRFAGRGWIRRWSRVTARRLRRSRVFPVQARISRTTRAGWLFVRVRAAPLRLKESLSWSKPKQSSIVACQS